MPVHGMGSFPSRQTHSTQYVLSNLLKFNLISNEESKSSSKSTAKMDSLVPRHAELIEHLVEDNTEGERTG
jgi:hypothetical protein